MTAPHTHDKLDNALKSYFSQREDTPPAVQLALREKLHTAAACDTQEKFSVLWLLSLSVLFASMLLLVALATLFGIGAILLSGIVYYILAMVSGAVIIVTSRLQSRLPSLQTTT